MENNTKGINEVDTTEIMTYIKGIEDNLIKLKSIIMPDADWKKTLTRRINILKEVDLANGGIVTYNEYVSILKKNQIDTRGAGPLFRKNLSKLPDGRVAITDEGKKQLKKWIEEVERL